MAGPLGGATGDPRASTVNTKNVDGRPPGPYRRGGRYGMHSGPERCVINLYGYERQKVILLTGLTFPAPSPAMAYDP
jgi:hypothetical protein